MERDDLETSVIQAPLGDIGLQEASEELKEEHRKEQEFEDINNMPDSEVEDSKMSNVDLDTIDLTKLDEEEF